MVQFVGCKKAKEVSLTKDPANDRAVMLMAKTRDAKDPPQTPSENDDMLTVEAAKTILGMSEITKAYFLTLEGEVAKTFLDKPTAEQAAEAEAAKKKADDAAAEATRIEEARKASEGATDEAVKATNARVAELEKALKDERQEREIEKAAADPDFIGYPGGVAAVTELLKTAYTVEGAARQTIIDTAKAHAKLAKATGSTELGHRNDRDITKSAPKTAEVQKIAGERAEKNGTTAKAEIAKMMSEPEHKALMGAYLAENDASADAA